MSNVLTLENLGVSGVLLVVQNVILLLVVAVFTEVVQYSTGLRPILRKTRFHIELCSSRLCHAAAGIVWAMSWTRCTTPGHCMILDPGLTAAKCQYQKLKILFSLFWSPYPSLPSPSTYWISYMDLPTNQITKLTTGSQLCQWAVVRGRKSQCGWGKNSYTKARVSERNGPGGLREPTRRQPTCWCTTASAYLLSSDDLWLQVATGTSTFFTSDIHDQLSDTHSDSWAVSPLQEEHINQTVAVLIQTRQASPENTTAHYVWHQRLE